MKQSLMLAALLLWGNAYGQMRLDYVVVGAGAAVLSGSNYSLSATVGEPTAGVSSGFWHGGAITATAIEEPEAELPASFDLHQNYPNPFNPSTTIPYDLPEASHVRLVIYDVLGREVEILVDRDMPPGRHSVAFEAGARSSGVYLYMIEMSGFRQVRSMLLVK